MNHMFSHFLYSFTDNPVDQIALTHSRSSSGKIPVNGIILVGALSDAIKASIDVRWNILIRGARIFAVRCNVINKTIPVDKVV